MTLNRRRAEIPLVILVLLAVASCESMDAMVSNDGEAVFDDLILGTPVTVATSDDQVISGYKIALFASAFLEDQEDPTSNFAVTSFLLFSDRSSRTYPQRRAAAEGFLCLFSDLKRAETIGAEPENLAVLYAPVLAGADLAEIRRERDPDRLLAHYSYTRSNLIRSWFATAPGIPLPAVSLVAVAKPYPFTEVDPQDVVWADLTDMHPGAVAATMEEFREHFIVNGPHILYAKEITSPPERDGIFRAFLFSFFGSIGEFIAAWTPGGREAEAGETPGPSSGDHQPCT